MNTVVDTLLTHGLVCRSLSPFCLKEIAGRKQLECYVGVDVRARYVVVFRRKVKAKLSLREAMYLEALVEEIERIRNHRIGVKVLLGDALMGQKATVCMKQNGWRNWHVSV
jgi:hypothetical protein